MRDSLGQGAVAEQVAVYWGLSGLYLDNGKENGYHYSILGLYRWKIRPLWKDPATSTHPHPWAHRSAGDDGTEPCVGLLASCLPAAHPKYMGAEEAKQAYWASRSLSCCLHHLPTLGSR